MCALLWRFNSSSYSLSEIDALGLLQHYGLPTPLIDFSGDLGHAFTFAAAEPKTIGRICVFPLRNYSKVLAVANFADNQWAERARRQFAFGVAMLDLADLKSLSVRRELGLRWFEFPIRAADCDFFRNKYRGLISTIDDPCAGFVRHEITEYVEAKGKFSPTLTNWLLARIPIIPRCFRVNGFEAANVLINHEPPSALGATDFAAEEEWSRKYWSDGFADSSWDRMRGWFWPPIGSIFADPRTFHGNMPGRAES